MSHVHISNNIAFNVFSVQIMILQFDRPNTWKWRKIL